MDSPTKPNIQADVILNETNAELHNLLIGLATSVENFPGFLGMETVQALMLETCEI